LHEQIRTGQIDKRYLTLIHGQWLHRRQHIKLPLFKYTTPEGERRVRVESDGQPSHTVFNLLRKYGEFVLLEAELKTGRTHQIRVHLAASGFPIVGDEKYGDFGFNRQMHKATMGRVALKRMFLHAWSLRFQHPSTGLAVNIESVLPPDCQRFLDSLAIDKANNTNPA
jgi:23S rRNA pseudouridine955/2504/2580 synthase